MSCTFKCELIKCILMGQKTKEKTWENEFFATLNPVKFTRFARLPLEIPNFCRRKI